MQHQLLIGEDARAIGIYINKIWKKTCRDNSKTKCFRGINNNMHTCSFY